LVDFMNFENYSCDNQMSIFDFTREPISITKPIRLIELFAGYGSQAMALKRIGTNFEHYRVVEFDKYAIASYNAVHGTDFPTMDITKVHARDLNICDTETFTYLLTYSFPCTDLSVAGKQAGMSKGSGTRSGLLWEVERILTEIRDSNGELPQILFMENVPQVHGKKNINDFEKWLGFSESLGYTNYWRDLNAKNYGVAQNRNRCFMFSFLGNYSYDFPQPIPLTKRIRDYLEGVVDDKFYVSDKALKGFAKHAKKQKEKGNSFHAVIKDVDDISSTIKSGYYKDGSDCLLKVAGKINSSQDGKVVYTDGIALTLTSGHCNVPKIAEPTMRKSCESLKLQHDIRKLTPRECGRLMGVSDDDIDKMAAVNSNTQLYKQFGNSIVVDVMCAMFKNLNINQ
jgi:DNA (cytosine-5)-methyltransferase 1